MGITALLRSYVHVSSYIYIHTYMYMYMQVWSYKRKIKWRAQISSPFEQNLHCYIQLMLSDLALALYFTDTALIAATAPELSLQLQILTRHKLSLLYPYLSYIIYMDMHPGCLVNWTDTSKPVEVAILTAACYIFILQVTSPYIKRGQLQTWWFDRLPAQTSWENIITSGADRKGTLQAHPFGWGPYYTGDCSTISGNCKFMSFLTSSHNLPPILP